MLEERLAVELLGAVLSVVGAAICLFGGIETSGRETVCEKMHFAISVRTRGRECQLPSHYRLPSQARLAV